MTQIETYRHRIYPHYKAICADAKVQAINAKRELSLFCTQWGSNWTCDRSAGNGNTVIVCDRPEGHAEAPMVECLAKAIGKLS